MAKIELAAAAERDLADIWSYIAADNPAAADRVLGGIVESLELLGRMPFIGRARPELGPKVRGYPGDHAVFFYLIKRRGVLVLRVVARGRHITSLF